MSKLKTWESSLTSKPYSENSSLTQAFKAKQEKLRVKALLNIWTNASRLWNKIEKSCLRNFLSINTPNKTFPTTFSSFKDIKIPKLKNNQNLNSLISIFPTKDSESCNLMKTTQSSKTKSKDFKSNSASFQTPTKRQPWKNKLKSNKNKAKSRKSKA